MNDNVLTQKKKVNIVPLLPALFCRSLFPMRNYMYICMAWCYRLWFYPKKKQKTKNKKSSNRYSRRRDVVVTILVSNVCNSRNLPSQRKSGGVCGVAHIPVKLRHAWHGKLVKQKLMYSVPLGTTYQMYLCVAQQKKEKKESERQKGGGVFFFFLAGF